MDEGTGWRCSDPAAWVIAGLRGFGESVLSLVPAGFPAYARVLHPAYRAGQPVRWAAVAAGLGRRTSPTMQFCALAGGHEPAPGGQFDEPPRAGALPPQQGTALVRVLGRHTDTPQRCWFALWDGWGDLPGWVRQAPVLSAEHRRYHLLAGSIDAFLDWEQPASLWWPQDRAWCVATDIDLDSTYLGAGTVCVAELLADPELECLAAEPGDGIAYDADPHNPPPPHPAG